MQIQRTDSTSQEEIVFSISSKQQLEKISSHMAEISAHISAIRETIAGGREDLRDREMRELARSAAAGGGAGGSKSEPPAHNADPGQGSIAKLIFSDRFLIFLGFVAIIAAACAVLVASGHPDTASVVIDAAKEIAAGKN
jgi:hypothetical protein